MVIQSLVEKIKQHFYMILCDCTSTLYSLFIATARKIDFKHHESGKTTYFSNIKYYQNIWYTFKKTRSPPRNENAAK